MNQLDLYLDSEVVLPYKMYIGKVQEKLLQLLSESRRPMDAPGYVKRLKQVSSSPEVLAAWNNSCPTIGDAIATFPNPYGGIIIVRGTPELWSFMTGSRLTEGAIKLSGTAYDALGGLHVPGIKMMRKGQEQKSLEEEIFSYLGLEKEQFTARKICFPKSRDYPYITLLGLSNSARVLGSSLLDEHDCLIGVK